MCIRDRPSPVHTVLLPRGGGVRPSWSSPPWITHGALRGVLVWTGADRGGRTRASRRHCPAADRRGSPRLDLLRKRWRRPLLNTPVVEGVLDDLGPSLILPGGSSRNVGLLKMISLAASPSSTPGPDRVRTATAVAVRTRRVEQSVGLHRGCRARLTTVS